MTDKTSSSETMAVADIKVGDVFTERIISACLDAYICQAEFEAKYNAQQEMLRGEIASLGSQAEFRAAEIRRLQSTVESYKLSNEELNVSRVLRRLD